MHTGMTIHQLLTTADRVIALSKDYRAVEVLKSAQMYLGEGQTSSRFPQDDDDVLACWLLSDVTFCIEKEQTEICRHCGDMRGLHARWTESCRLPVSLNDRQSVVGKTFEAKEAQ